MESNVNLIQVALDPMTWQNHFKGRRQSRSVSPKDFKEMVLRAMVDKTDEEETNDQSHRITTFKNWQINTFCHLVYHKAAILLKRLSGCEAPSSSTEPHISPRSAKSARSSKSPRPSRSPPLTYSSDAERRRVYLLALSTQKHEPVLRGVLEESTYTIAYDWLFTQYPHTVLVMLYDFHVHKFRQKYILQLCDRNKVHLVQAVQDIRESLFKMRIKIAASFARVRIEHCAATLDDTLPMQVREVWKRILDHPVYARVNPLLADRHEVYDLLKTDGFVRRGKGWKGSGEQPLNYQNDCHYKELLVFPTYAQEEAYCTTAARQRKIIFQDKSVFVIGDIVANIVQEMVRVRKSSRHALLPLRKTSSRHMPISPSLSIPGNVFYVNA